MPAIGFLQIGVCRAIRGLLSVAWAMQNSRCKSDAASIVALLLMPFNPIVARSSAVCSRRVSFPQDGFHMCYCNGTA
ncbi:hypothetical protein V6N13_005272 [Hibiscus sabdariffa]